MRYRAKPWDTITDEGLAAIVADAFRRWPPKDPAWLAREAGRLARMSQPERQLKAEFRRLAGYTGGLYEFMARTLRVTPYIGAYGLAGFVFVLEGTPPWGTMLVQGAETVTGPASLHDATIGFFYKGKAKPCRSGWIDGRCRLIALTTAYLIDAGMFEVPA